MKTKEQFEEMKLNLLKQRITIVEKIMDEKIVTVNSAEYDKLREIDIQIELINKILN